jgi:hypothetical protein
MHSYVYLYVLEHDLTLRWSRSSLWMTKAVELFQEPLNVYNVSEIHIKMSSEDRQHETEADGRRRDSYRVVHPRVWKPRNAKNH